MEALVQARTLNAGSACHHWFPSRNRSVVAHGSPGVRHRWHAAARKLAVDIFRNHAHKQGVDGDGAGKRWPTDQGSNREMESASFCPDSSWNSRDNRLPSRVVLGSPIDRIDVTWRVEIRQEDAPRFRCRIRTSNRVGPSQPAGGIIERCPTSRKKWTTCP